MEREKRCVFRMQKIAGLKVETCKKRRICQNDVCVSRKNYHSRFLFYERGFFLAENTKKRGKARFFANYRKF